MRKAKALIKLPKARQAKPKQLLIKPDPLDPRLSQRVTGVDQTGRERVSKEFRKFDQLQRIEDALQRCLGK